MLPTIAVFLVILTLAIVLIVASIKGQSNSMTLQTQGASFMALFASCLVAFSGTGAIWITIGTFIAAFIIVMGGIMLFL
jgi:hypothetical protein